MIAGGTDVDVALMGGGLDTFTWGPGEGNDIVEGGAGTDFLQMNGSGGNDRFDVLPVGSRTRVTRDIENVNLDLGGLERVDLLPGPGGDIVRVADLSGTATDRVDVNLMVARGQTGGDNLIDRVFIDGTFGNDTINVNGAGPDVRTTGLAAITTVRGTDPELDRLHVDTKPGVDALTVTGTTNQLIGFTFSSTCSRRHASKTASRSGRPALDHLRAVRDRLARLVALDHRVQPRDVDLPAARGRPSRIEVSFARRAGVLSSQPITAIPSGQRLERGQGELVVEARTARSDARRVRAPSAAAIARRARRVHREDRGAVLGGDGLCALAAGRRRSRRTPARPAAARRSARARARAGARSRPRRRSPGGRRAWRRARAAPG